MLKSYPAPRQWHIQGQILLERALFCVGCEIIFTGTRHCPRCSSVEAVWPLSEWVRSVRPATTVAPVAISRRGITAIRPRAQALGGMTGAA